VRTDVAVGSDAESAVESVVVPVIASGAARRWRHDSSQPSGLVNGSSTRRTGGEASSRARTMAPRVVTMKPVVVCSWAKDGQPATFTVFSTNPWNR
jgi:hypothetical protein